MSVIRPERSAARRGAKVSELRPTRPPEAVPSELMAPDGGYVFALVSLISIGMIMVYSTTAVYSDSDDLIKMGLWMALGVPGIILASRFPMDFWQKLTPWLMIGCLGALIFLEIPGNPLAVTVNGATRWIQLPGFRFQPSELTKLALVLFAAKFLEKRGERMNRSTWGLFLGMLALYGGIIYKEPDLGTALVLAGTAFCMLVAAGARTRDLIGLALVGAVTVAVLAWNTDHQRERLEAWWNPWAEEYVMDKGYQVTQSWMAMARGGLTGVGLGQSTQKLGNRLPESETDFIFAIVAEELGMVRAMGVLLLFGLLAWRGYGIAARAPDRYSGLVTVGVTSWVAVQSCLNIAVVTGTVPNTGVPLPFISSGGSSLVTLMVAAGIVIGVSRRRRPAKRTA